MKSLIARTESNTHQRPALATAVLLAVASAPAAANWDWTPSIAAGLEYNSNAILTSDPDVDASVDGYVIDADVGIAYKTQLSEFWLFPRLIIRRYNDASIIDSNDTFLDLDYSYRGQKSFFRFRGTYADESIRTAELFDGDYAIDNPDDIPDDDTGDLANPNRRIRTELIPEWSYKFGQRSTFRTYVDYLDVTYDQDTDISLGSYSDYTDAEVNAFYDWQYSPRTTAVFGGYYRVYDAEGNPEEIPGYGATIGFNHDLSETVQFRIAAGVDSTEDDNLERATNPVGEISISRQTQTVRMLAAYVRDISGDGAGALAVRDTIFVNWTRDLSQLITVGAGIRAYRTSPLESGEFLPDERDYAQLRGFLTWNLSRTLAIDFEYSYSYVDRKVDETDADANQANIWFRWHAIR